MYKMNDIVNQVLLVVDKFMPEMYLKQTGFIDKACGPFNKNKERIQKFKETGDTRYIYRNELDKACFQHDMTYRDFKDLARRTALDKEYDGYQTGLALMIYKFFDKKNSSSGVKSMPNQQLAEELHQPIIRKFPEAYL